jgi:phosphodiesterase/alkaline phosphatase D-like protein
MLVECSTLESFKTIIGVASSEALPEHDFTSKVLLQGLPAGQDIFYRVRFEDIGETGISGETQVGHFRTAPAAQGSRSQGSRSQALYGAFEVKHIFYTTLHFLHSSFFVRLGIPFLRPDPHTC